MKHVFHFLMDVNKYLEERKKKFPTHDKKVQKENRIKELKTLGVLLNDTTNKPIKNYQHVMQDKQLKIQKQKVKILNYLLKDTKHKQNSLLLEALSFIKNQNYLQLDEMPDELKYTYQTREILLKPEARGEQAPKNEENWLDDKNLQ